MTTFEANEEQQRLLKKCGYKPGAAVAWMEHTANEYGEQLVFVVDVGGEAALYHSDYDWKRVVVLNLPILGPTAPGILLAAEELAWVRDCWNQSAEARTAPATP